MRTCFLEKLPRFPEGAAAFRLLKRSKTPRRLQPRVLRQPPSATATSSHAPPIVFSGPGALAAAAHHTRTVCGSSRHFSPSPPGAAVTASTPKPSIRIPHPDLAPQTPPHQNPPPRPVESAQYNKPSYTVAPDLPKNAKLHGSFHPSFHINHLRIAPFSPFQVTFVLLAKPSNRRFSRPPGSRLPHISPLICGSPGRPAPSPPRPSFPFTTSLHHFFAAPRAQNYPSPAHNLLITARTTQASAESLSPSVPKSLSSRDPRPGTRDPRPQTQPLPPPSPCGNRQACPTFR